MAEQIVKTEYSEVMQKSYIDYAMSVICARALPDIRDGLKPVQRRVLYAMDQLGLNYDKPHRKSARIVGDTMGKFHPHGDSSIYEALVVLEQDFKKGMALVDGHGNFGSIEGDGAAAMRYTEAKLKKFTQDVYLADLNKNIVDFIPNFDETEKEPEVLPVKVPNILINGAEGIAVGMTTSIPTHNLGEVIDGVIAYMDNNDITNAELMEYVKGPDFPTGGLVVNKSELLSIYETGTGKIKLRGKVVFEEGKKKDRDKLVITEIPYTMVGKEIGKFIADVSELVESKKIQDIVDISNESSKEGIRIVLELKKNTDINNLKNYLYKKTKLEDTFGVNMLAIVDGRPETLGLKDIIAHNVKFQFELATRKYTNLLEKDLEQKEIKEGLIRACNVIDLIIEIIRGSNSQKDAKDCLVNGNTEKIKFKNKESRLYAENLRFTEKQAQAILELRLYRLIGLEILALEKEYSELIDRIAGYEEILSDRKVMAKVIKKELKEIKKEYAVPRKTIIEDGEEVVFEEKKITEQQVMFIMDRFGYAKTVDISVYERNKEAITQENKYIFPCMNTDRICIFTDNGNLHLVKVLNIPYIKKFRDKGTPIDNLGNYDSSGENIVFISDFEGLRNKKLLFVTKNGMIKLVNSNEFDVIKKTVASTKLGKDDSLIAVKVTNAMTEDEAAKIMDEQLIEPVFLSGGSDDFIMEDDFSDSFVNSGDFDDIYGDAIQLSMNTYNNSVEINETEREDGGIVSNELVVLQTHDGYFLRFPLREIPETKKTAIGVKGIKLIAGDYVKDAYVLDAGDSYIINEKGKEIDLRNFKTTKRGNRGVKVK